MKPLALISGGTSGIGLATAQRLNGRYRLALIYARQAERARQAEQLLEDCRTFAVDVASDEAVRAGYAEITQVFEATPSVLVNCAGVGRALDFFVQRRSLDSARELMNVNFFGTLRMVQAVLPAMYSRRSGAIVNVSSVSARGGYKGYVGYAESKAAVECFTRNLAAEVAHRGIAVNCVAPGLMESREGEEFVQQAAAESLNSPLGRLLTGQEVALTIEHLITLGPAVNGQVLTVDGGNSVLRHQSRLGALPGKQG